MKGIFAFFGIFLLDFGAFAADLLIGGEDLRLVYVAKESSSSSDPVFDSNFSDIEGFHLYIRKKPDIESVLLCDTTKDPDGKSDNFSYRAPSYNSVNGDEVTYLNGKPLVSEYSKYRLADSTTEPHKELGEAFHVYIPKKLLYGYPWSRSGEIDVKKGTFVNIRTFTKKYADYDGGEFADNPFMFDLEVVKSVDAPPTLVPVLTDNYSPDAAQSFNDIAESTGGEMVASTLERLPEDIMDSLGRIPQSDKVDVVFAIDATGSMKDDVKVLREKWYPKLEKAYSVAEGERGSVRFGLLLYRDYTDDYKYKKLPVKFYDFTESLGTFKKNLYDFYISGGEGGDIPEAVYEALYAAEDFYSWRKDAERKIILIGDAEPHPTPRGSKKYTKDLVLKRANSDKITIDTIIVPDNKKDRGRK